MTWSSSVKAQKRAVGLRRLNRRAPLKRSVREAIYGYAFLLPWLIGFIIFNAGPMLGSLGISFFRTNFMKETRFVGLKWWGNVFTDRLVRKAFINTVYFVFVSVPLRTMLALAIAILLNQGIVAQGVWRTIYYLPSLVSGVAVSVLWRWMYHPESGVFNALLRLVGITGPRWIYSQQWAMPSLIIMSLWGAGSAMLIYLAGLRGIPTVLYEAAEIDGAGTVKRFVHITIPMLTPTIFFNLVMNLIGGWQVFTQAFVMTGGGPNNATLTSVLLLYKTGFGNAFFGYASAQAWVLFLVILLFVGLNLKSASAWVHYERI